MKKYEAYKESGVETIGEIPNSWNILSIKYIAEIFGRIGFRGYTVEDIVSEGQGAISLSPSNIQDQKLVLKKRTFLSWEKYEESPEIKIYEGDVILVKTASVGKVAYVDNLKDYEATLNPQLIVFKNIKLNSKYFYYLLISEVMQKKIESDTNGGVVGTLTQKSINSYQILRPSEIEQTQIAAYLDYQTGIIDQIIEKKELLIKKLKEQRQAIINEAVTKGVNSSGVERPPMKDSGIEWLGEIPQQWEVSRLDYMSDIIDPQPDHRAPKMANDGLPYLGIRDINEDGTINVNRARIVEVVAVEKQERSFTIEDGDIVFGKVGTLANPKHISLGGERVALSATLVLIKTVDTLKSRFLKYALDSNYIWQQINTVIVGATRPALGITQIRKFRIVKPSNIDMEEIVSILDYKTTGISTSINSVKKSIEKLKEYRQSIISEAVTGKIDVRDWQRPS